MSRKICLFRNVLSTCQILRSSNPDSEHYLKNDYMEAFQRENELEKRWNGIKRDLRILFKVLPNYVKPRHMNFFTSLLGPPSEWLFQVRKKDHKTIPSDTDGNYHELLWLLESALFRKRFRKILKYMFLVFGGCFPQAGALMWCWRRYPSEILIPSKRTPLKTDEKWFFTNGVNNNQ
jgi:hypothetical protein